MSTCPSLHTRNLTQVGDPTFKQSRKLQHPLAHRTQIPPPPTYPGHLCGELPVGTQAAMGTDVLQRPDVTLVAARGSRGEKTLKDGQTQGRGREPASGSVSLLGSTGQHLFNQDLPSFSKGDPLLPGLPGPGIGTFLEVGVGGPETFWGKTGLGETGGLTTFFGSLSPEGWVAG